MFKSFLTALYLSAYRHNELNILQALELTGPHGRLLDVGCWDGSTTLEWGKWAKSSELFGIEPVKTAAKLAGRKFSCYEVQADRGKWPVSDGFLDCVISNQVVEHLSDVDHFYSQAARVLKPGGYLITSTNNLSSWHNILALILGWAPFDLTNSSHRSMGIGNPLAVHHGESDSRGSSWTHKTIYTARWLREWGSIYGLEHVMDLGAGYYPLPTFLANLDKLHSAFITQVLRKSK